MAVQTHEWDPITLVPERRLVGSHHQARMPSMSSVSISGSIGFPIRVTASPYQAKPSGRLGKSTSWARPSGFLGKAVRTPEQGRPDS